MFSTKGILVSSLLELRAGHVLPEVVCASIRITNYITTFFIASNVLTQLQTSSFSTNFLWCCAKRIPRKHDYHPRQFRHIPSSYDSSTIEKWAICNLVPKGFQQRSKEKGKRRPRYANESTPTTRVKALAPSHLRSSLIPDEVIVNSFLYQGPQRPPSPQNVPQLVTKMPLQLVPQHLSTHIHLQFLIRSG